MKDLIFALFFGGFGLIVSSMTLGFIFCAILKSYVESDENEH